jgi:hypothetical protein
MGHMGMIMDENNLKVYLIKKIISCKCNRSIIARMVKGGKL